MCPCPARAARAAFVLGLGLAAAPAASGDIVMERAREAGCLGTASCRIGPATLTAGPAPVARFTRQHYSGVTGLGVMATDTGADRDDEIQGPVLDRRLPGESVTIAFDTPSAIARIVLAHLYNPDMPGDPAETAVIEGFRDGESLGTLRLTSVDNDAGAFLLAGSARVGAVRRLATLPGQFALFEPFGAPVDRLVLTAAAVAAGDTADYSLVSVTVAPGH